MSDTCQNYTPLCICTGILQRNKKNLDLLYELTYAYQDLVEILQHANIVDKEMALKIYDDIECV